MSRDSDPSVSADPKISVVMVDGSFRQKFHTIDFFARQSLPADDYEVLWVEYYDKLQAELSEKIRLYTNCRTITLNRDDEYHSSFCFNAGIRESRGELLVIPDADVVVDERFLEMIWNDHCLNEKLVMYVYRWDEDANTASREPELHHLRTVCSLKNAANYGGCLTVRKKWLLDINGYEQHPIFGSGFHANGLDIYTRLKNLGLHVMWHPTLKMYHPWHPMTRTESKSYDLQQLVIQHRALTLEAMAHEGLDPERNRPMPPDLAARIADAQVPRWKSPARLFRRIRKTLS